MQKLRQDINIGINISKLRKNTGYTQEQVVARMQLMNCEISRTSYSKMENGKYHIKVRDLAVMRSIFKAEYDEFFEGIMLNDIY